jgi:hypothetical protein
MGRVAWDILVIPGVSISVEHLFSSLKHTLSDARSSMTAETASVEIFTKEWLKSGLAEGRTIRISSKFTKSRIYSDTFISYRIQRSGYEYNIL